LIVIDDILNACTIEQQYPFNGLWETKANQEVDMIKKEILSEFGSYLEGIWTNAYYDKLNIKVR
jgi:hypothetical protein